MIAALAVVVLGCLRLGLWQLHRYTSGGGSLQNLGYTLQWPTFAVFAVVMWWRLRRLERERTAAGTGTAPRPPAPSRPTPRTATIGPDEPDEPDEPDDELAAYNRYLAELNAAAARREND